MRRPAHRSVRNGTYKLVYEPGPRGGEPRRDSPYALYDLAADPAERFDHLEEPHRSERTERAFEVIRAMLETAVPPYERPPARRVPVDPAVREHLEALGYLED